VTVGEKEENEALINALKEIIIWEFQRLTVKLMKQISNLN
jgi:hypothetical protein